jgi:hypothetical protein
MLRVTLIADNFVSAPVALIMRVFITSTGEQAVVATRPYLFFYNAYKYKLKYLMNR